MRKYFTQRRKSSAVLLKGMVINAEERIKGINSVVIILRGLGIMLNMQHCTKGWKHYTDDPNIVKYVELPTHSKDMSGQTLQVIILI